MIIGTAGHIDHGKTLLVKALTGVETDRLKEEKARGITIELGFAYVPLPSGGVLGFVDVPGHERFVHTMLAGAASIEFVMLVVAANDGVMPQTREHLHIIDLLGIEQGLVALNKVDLVDDARQVEVTQQIRSVLAGSTLESADILPVSAVTGAGISELKQRLFDEAMSRPERAEQGAFRMSIDRSFTVAGSGTVVTGGIVAGSVAVGDRVLVLPGGHEVRVRTLHAQGRQAERASVGERCALNLAGIEKTALARGQWLVDPAQPFMTSRFDASMRLLPGKARASKAGTRVHLHLGTSEVLAQLAPLEDEALSAQGSGLAQLLLNDPLPARAGDCFVVRDAAAERTIGGGRVIDPRAPKRLRRSPARLAILAALRDRDHAAALDAALALSPGIVDYQAFAIDRGLSAAEAEAVLARLQPKRIDIAGVPFVAGEALLAKLAEAVGAALTRFHADRPELPGQSPEGLRLVLQPRLPKHLFAPALSLLVAEGMLVADTVTVRLPTHVSSLGATDAKLWERVAGLLAQTPTRPPQVREMAEHLGQPVATIRKLCKTMARIGKIVEVASDRFFLLAALIELGKMAEHLSQGAPDRMFTAAQFRDRSGSGRNIGIQILEYFDRQGLTLRRGDVRSVVRDPVTVFDKVARRA